MDHKEAAAQASVIRDALTAHLWSWGMQPGPNAEQTEMAHSCFHKLAAAMGYRVERIGGEINTGKPAVAGGV